MATIVLLPIALAALLYCPPIQQWAVDIAARYASEATGKEITIEAVRLRFPLDLELECVCVRDAARISWGRRPTLHRDTLLSARRAICEVQLKPLFDKRVEIDIMQLDSVKLNTATFIPDCRVRGSIARLLVTSHGIDLGRDTLLLNKAALDGADLDICLADTAQKDTTSAPTPWRIKLAELSVKDTRLTVHLPGDTLVAACGIGSLTARGGDFDLYRSAYRLARADLNRSSITYDNRFKQRTRGLDHNHIALTGVNIGIDTLRYDSRGLAVGLRAAAMREKSGLALSSLKGGVVLDTASVHLHNLALTTPSSSLTGNVSVAFAVPTVAADLTASIGREDVMLVAGDMLPREIRRLWPVAPATLTCRASGSMKRCMIEQLRLNIPALLSADVSGTLTGLDTPSRMSLDARLAATAAGRNGSIAGNATFRMANMEYKANLSVTSLNAPHFLPGYGLGRFTGSLAVTGHGFDPFSPRTALTVTARVRRFAVGGHDLSGTTANCRLSRGMAHATVSSKAAVMSGDITLDALVSRRRISATVGADLRNLDLYALRLLRTPLSTGLCGHIDIDTDLRDNFRLLGHVSDIRLTDTARVFHPDDIEADILTRRDTTHAVVDCGDFHLRVGAPAGVRRLTASLSAVGSEITRQLQGRIIDEAAMRRHLPTATVSLRTGMENPLSRILSHLGYSFAAVNADLTASPASGLNGTLAIDTLRTTDLQLDDIRLTLVSDSSDVRYNLDVVNGPKNPGYTFAATLNGELMPNGTSAQLSVDDGDGKRGLDLSLSAAMEPDGIRLSLGPKSLILGYRRFTPNADNHVFLARNLRVAANVRLAADDGTGLMIFTDDDNADALQDITVSVHKLDLAPLCAAIPYMPDITGVMDGDFHAIMTGESTTVSADVSADALTYEGCLLGNLSSEIVYMPQSDGSHHVDGILSKDGREVATVVGTYHYNEGTIEATVSARDLPLDIINGFIPDQIIGLKGTGTGELAIRGRVQEPVIDGTLDLSGGALISVPYGVELAMDDTPVRIEGSRLVLKDFNLYDSNHTPLTVNGVCDFSQLDAINVSLGVKGENIQIINAKESRRSEAYGKAFVNFYASVQGIVDRLQVRAKLDVLPSTNLYYILRDSPITTDNRLKELVTFTDFSQSSPTPTLLPTVDGMNVTMSISVLAGSHVTCWLNTAHTNYLDLIGSGDLRMLYTADKLALTGRYTIAEGEMKYSLPVIPLKTFTITEDSYIEFTGDVMNPTLHITATERNRAAVNDDGQSRPVDFSCGVTLSKTLQDMGLEFIISAPEDQAVSDALNTMSVEERGKLAVTMLTTGMYLSDTNTSSMTMNSALSSFLQQEINNITGAALKTLDLSVGLENSTQADGTMSTDYAFKFSKRLWNNRVAISVGGRIATGTQAAGKTNSFFDNVELQYRLSDTSNQYLRLFYKHNVYDYLEGYLDQYGGGYMWKRKLQTFKEIFRSAAVKTVTKPDSTTNTRQ